MTTKLSLALTIFLLAGPEADEPLDLPPLIVRPKVDGRRS